MTHLDVAGGTGDVAFRVLRELRRAEEKARRGGGGGGGGGGRARDFDPGRVIVSDINPAMLAEGRKRARGRGLMGLNAVDAKGDALLAKLEFVEGNAESLPFEDASVDVYTIAFGLRNVTNAKAALRDALRLLKPGGRFMCLEFSHVTQEPLRSMYDLYSFNVIPALGELVAKDEASYRYLVESIRKFPKQRELEDMMRDVGFKSVSHDNLTGGVVAIHEGRTRRLIRRVVLHPPRPRDRLRLDESRSALHQRASTAASRPRAARRRRRGPPPRTRSRCTCRSTRAASSPCRSRDTAPPDRRT
eukprot:31504-Pelagococcus_subviridis.AAC.13